MPLPALPNMAVQDCSPVRTISSKSTSTRTGKRDWWPPVRSPGYPARTSGKNTPRWQQGPAARLFLRPGKVSACGAGCCCGWPGQPDARQVLPPCGRPPPPRFHAQLRGFCRGRIAAPPKRDGLPGWALTWEALWPAVQNAGRSWPCRWPRHRPFLSRQHAFSG